MITIGLKREAEVQKALLQALFLSVDKEELRTRLGKSETLAGAQLRDFKFDFADETLSLTIEYPMAHKPKDGSRHLRKYKMTLKLENSWLAKVEDERCRSCSGILGPAGGAMRCIREGKIFCASCSKITKCEDGQPHISKPWSGF